MATAVDKAARLHHDLAIIAASLPEAKIPKNTMAFYQEILGQTRREHERTLPPDFPDATEETQYRDLLVMVGQLLVVMSDR